MKNNMLTGLSDSTLGPFKWVNPTTITCLADSGIRIDVPNKCDYFQDPARVHVMDTAPYLYTEVEGDFVAQIHISHAFKNVWDAGALMVCADDTHWAKLCFEGTDFGTQAIVSVVTNGLSDDANGVNYHWPNVWLQIVRKGNLFGMHYGPDGATWNMVRYFHIEMPSTVKVGMVAQCPGGPGTVIDFFHFGVENKCVLDIRAGI